jgi:hypothetical protein
MSKHVMSVHRWGDKPRASVRQCAGSDTRWVWGCMSPRSGLDWWSCSPYTVIVLMMSWFTVLLVVHSFSVCLRWFRGVLEIMLLDFNIDSDNETLMFLYFAFKYVVRSPDWNHITVNIDSVVAVTMVTLHVAFSFPVKTSMTLPHELFPKYTSSVWICKYDELVQHVDVVREHILPWQWGFLTNNYLVTWGAFRVLRYIA